MPTITTNDGAQLSYEDVGEGPPLILVPGWGCTHRFFQKNTAALARSCRVIAPDMRAQRLQEGGLGPPHRAVCQGRQGPRQRTWNSSTVSPPSWATKSSALPGPCPSDKPVVR